MSKVLNMTFALPGNKTHTLSLSDPKENLTMTSVMAVMNTVIAKQAILANNVPVEAFKDAHIKETTIIPLA